MGTSGSGNWYRWNRKTTVEESLTLSIQDFRGRIHPTGSGQLKWTCDGQWSSSIGYVVTWGDWPIITLRYRTSNQEDVRTLVVLQTTPTRFGRGRWWFTCPLIVDDVACQRRVGRLHLPPGAKYFGCRTCHQLTYRSCQEAHKAERMAALLSTELGCDLDTAETLLAHHRGMT